MSAASTNAAPISAIRTNELMASQQQQQKQPTVEEPTMIQVRKGVNQACQTCFAVSNDLFGGPAWVCRSCVNRFTGKSVVGESVPSSSPDTTRVATDKSAPADEKKVVNSLISASEWNNIDAMLRKQEPADTHRPLSVVLQEWIPKIGSTVRVLEQMRVRDMQRFSQSKEYLQWKRNPNGDEWTQLDGLTRATSQCSIRDAIRVIVSSQNLMWLKADGKTIWVRTEW